MIYSPAKIRELLQSIEKNLNEEQKATIKEMLFNYNKMYVLTKEKIDYVERMRPEYVRESKENIKLNKINAKLTKENKLLESKNKEQKQLLEEYQKIFEQVKELTETTEKKK